MDILSENQYKQIENRKKLKIKILKNAKIKGSVEDIGAVLMVVGLAVVIGAAALFLAGAISLMAAATIAAIGIAIFLIGLFLFLFEPPKLNMGTRGAPSYSQFSTDTPVYGSGKPIAQIVGISKIGAMITDKRVFGDNNSYGYATGIISDSFGIEGVIAIYDKEKLIFHLTSTRSENVLYEYLYPIKSLLSYTYVTEYNKYTVSYDISLKDYNPSKIAHIKKYISNHHIKLIMGGGAFIDVKDFLAAKYLSMDTKIENLLGLKILDFFLGKTDIKVYKFISGYVKEYQYIPVSIVDGKPEGGTTSIIGYNRVFINYEQEKGQNYRHITNPGNSPRRAKLDRPANEDIMLDINISIGYQERVWELDYRKFDKSKMNVDTNTADLPGEGQVEIQTSGLNISALSSESAYKVAFGMIPIYYLEDGLETGAIIAQWNVGLSFSPGAQDSEFDIIIKNKYDDSIVSKVTIITDKLHNGSNCHEHDCTKPRIDKSKGKISRLGGTLSGYYSSGHYQGYIFDIQAKSDT